MKVVDFKVPKVKKEAFRFQEDHRRFFYDQLHQHPEIQIMLITEGEGTLIAGDYVGRFTSGDLFVIGSGLPHVFRSDRKYYSHKSKLKAKSLSVYFNESYWGNTFWELEELGDLRKFTDRSARALQVTGKTKSDVSKSIVELQKLQGMVKLIVFFSLLKILIESKETRPLTVTAFQRGFDLEEGKRMNAILTFTFKACHRKIYIQEVAAIANLSAEAFCRYFKVRTQKTYTSFLNEVRVSNACQLLINNDLSIQDVCYQSGFSNNSNFNRIFKRVTGKVPSRYLR